MKKNLLSATVLLGVLGLGFSGQAFAADPVGYQTIDGKNTADITVKGNVGEIDNTDPETPLPDGDDRWINVTLPSEVIFGLKDGAKDTITSGEYKITNNSGRPVKVDVTKYTLGGDGAPAIKTLNITRKAGHAAGGAASTSKTVSLASNGVTSKPGTTTDELVRLANSKSQINGKPGSKETTFSFDGTVDNTKLKPGKNTNLVDSTLTMKFTSLRMTGNTVIEEK